MTNRYGKETSGAGILNYHSSHEERVAASPQLEALRCERERRPGGIMGRLFGKNRGARFTFLNMIALAVLFIFYQVVMARNPAGIWRDEGFQFSLSAFAREDKAFVSLRITKEEGGLWQGALPEIILESAGVSETFTPGLPLKQAEVAYVRTVLPLQGAGDEARKVFCRVVFAGKEKTLAVAVKEE
jgi:hypothetical protein